MEKQSIRVPTPEELMIIKKWLGLAKWEEHAGIEDEEASALFRALKVDSLDISTVRYKDIVDSFLVGIIVQMGVCTVEQLPLLVKLREIGKAIGELYSTDPDGFGAFQSIEEMTLVIGALTF